MWERVCVFGEGVPHVCVFSSVAASPLVSPEVICVAAFGACSEGWGRTPAGRLLAVGKSSRLGKPSPRLSPLGHRPCLSTKLTGWRLTRPSVFLSACLAPLRPPCCCVLFLLLLLLFSFSLPLELLEMDS